MDPATSAELYELHARVWKAIADPKRLLLINEMRDGSKSVGDLCDAIRISQSNASQHLAVLRDRGLVRSQRAGSNVYYSLSSPKIVQAVVLLREFLAEDLADRGALGSVATG